MKKMKNDPDLLEEYDFSGGVRGKHAKEYAAGTNAVLLDPDVAEFFPDSDSVNRALRSLIEIADRLRKARPSASEKSRRASARETMVNTTVTYTLEHEGKFYIIEHVPARVCEESGEQFFSPETVERIQAIFRGKTKPNKVIETPVYEYA
jgi:YgiT-type zinc finger domain-containing protein